MHFELRDGVLRALAFTVVAVGVCLYYYKELTTALESPAQSGDSMVKFVQLAPGEFFFVSVKVAFSVGLLIAFPYALFEAALYFTPALTRSERNVVGPTVLASALLFYSGALFSYSVLSPAALGFFLGYSQDPPMPTNSTDVKFSNGGARRSRVALGLLGVIDSQKLFAIWRYVVVGSAIVGAILTPSTDPVTQLLLSGALCALYFAGGASPYVCELRLPLLMEYSAYFKKTVILLGQESPPPGQVDSLGPRVFEPPCGMAALQEVTLIIHCTQQQLCYKRRSMLQEFVFYFKRVIFLMRSKMWTLSHTCSGEAYACVAEEMKHIRMNDDTRSERGTWMGFSGLYYLPKQVYPVFQGLAAAFKEENVSNESLFGMMCEKSPAKEYSAYFKKTVIFLTKDPGWLPGAVPCHRVGDPYWCIAEEIPRSKDSSGILYMQFDVGMSPCEMARRLDVGAVGTFETLSDKYSTFAQLDECNTNLKLRCLWHHWDMKRNSTRTRLLKTAKALDEISSTLPFANTSILQRLETGIWSAVSDFLYLPKQAFPVYAAFAKAFKENKIFHEMASPTLLMTSARISNVPMQNFRCRGSCCRHVQQEEILSKGFICGHKVRLQDDCHRNALQLLATQEPRNLRTVNANAPPVFAPPCEMAGLDNVTLIIHCSEQELCYARRLLLQDYFLYFRHVIFLTPKGLPWSLARTCAGEAYQCVVDELESSSSVNSRGILFLNFEVAMSPCEMARHLEVDKVGTSEELRNTTFAKLDEWNSKKLTRQQRYWDAQNKTRTQIMNAVRSLDMGLEGWAVQSLRNGSIFRLFSGFFYLPQKAFPIFKAAAPILNEWNLTHATLSH
eukprot:g23562.t1